MKRISAVLLATTAFCLWQPAGAQSLYGSEFNGNALYDINKTTGSFITRCDPSTTNLPGIAWDPNTNTLYGTDQENLYTVNRATCVATLVGSHGATVSGLTFNSALTTLYAIGYDENLYSINPATGAATSVGVIGAGIGTGGYDVTDLATRSDGMVFSTGVNNHLYTVNLATGAFTDLGALTGTTGAGITAIAFDNLDVLYGIDTTSDRLLTIDTATLATTFVSAAGIGGDVRGLAYVTAAQPLPSLSAAPVPALDTTGLLLLAGLLSVAALLAVRR